MQLQELHKGGCTTVQPDMAALVTAIKIGYIKIRVHKFKYLLVLRIFENFPFFIIFRLIIVLQVNWSTLRGFFRKFNIY